MKTVEIPLTRGFLALIDESDLPLVSDFKWFAADGNRTRYAHRTINFMQSGRKTARIIRMHRLIVEAKPGDIVDHINGNGLDNRRTNLRIVSHAENCQNRIGPRSDNKSGANGVYLDSKIGWRAYITTDGKRKWLGVFSSFDAAVTARMNAEAALWRRG